jgi:anti-sigma B factor antagonist
MPDTPAVSIEPLEKIICAVVHRSELNDSTLDELQRELSAAAAQRPHLSVALDLTQVKYVPSMALGMLVMLMRHLKTTQQRLILVGLQPEVRTVLAITRLDKLFEIHPNLEAALSHHRGTPGAQPK